MHILTKKCLKISIVLVEFNFNEINFDYFFEAKIHKHFKLRLCDSTFIYTAIYHLHKSDEMKKANHEAFFHTHPSIYSVIFISQ